MRPAEVDECSLESQLWAASLDAWRQYGRWPVRVQMPGPPCPGTGVCLGTTARTSSAGRSHVDRYPEYSLVWGPPRIGTGVARAG
jgi:hypothetical protein